MGMVITMASMTAGQAMAQTNCANDDKVLLTIDNEPVYQSEFDYIYEKNNQADAVDPKTREEYLDLFINFKLKVKEAQNQGMDTTEAFRKELAGYRAQATPKYMKDQEAIDSLVQLSYQRMSMDRRAAHIVLQCKKGENDSTEQAVLKRINDIRKKANSKNFKELAKQYSEDPEVEKTEGELGWIMPFRFVYSIEDAVYNTPVGEISQVVRSNFGYHIILVEEEKAHEEIHAAHIMKMCQETDAEAVRKAKLAIDSIYALLQDGADFEGLAQQMSDDKGSSVRGGDLSWFAKGRMVPQFEQAAFALTKDGEISKPVQSRFGFHIIKRYETRGILPYDSLKMQIQKQTLRDERAKEADKSFIRKARKEYSLPDSMSDGAVREYVDLHLEEKYPELCHLVKEYHDGILLFNVSLENVWDKAGNDEEGLTRYFNLHKKEYKWDEPKWKGYVIYAKDMATANQAKAIVKNAHPDSINSYINQRINTDSVKYVRVERGLWKKGQNGKVDQVGFKDKKAEYTPSEEMPVVVVMGKIIKAPVEYRDEKSKVVAAYQDELEKIWIQELRKKYHVEIVK